MKRLWIMATCSSVAVGLLAVARAPGRAQGAEGAPAVSSTALVEMVVPASAEKQMRLESENLITARTGEVQTSGNVVIRLSNGVQLNMHQVQVRLVSGGANGEQRIFINPLCASPARK